MRADFAASSSVLYNFANSVSPAGVARRWVYYWRSSSFMVATTSMALFIVKQVHTLSANSQAVLVYSTPKAGWYCPPISVLALPARARRYLHMRQNVQTDCAGVQRCRVYGVHYLSLHSRVLHEYLQNSAVFFMGISHYAVLYFLPTYAVSRHKRRSVCNTCTETRI